MSDISQYHEDIIEGVRDGIDAQIDMDMILDCLIENGVISENSRERVRSHINISVTWK